MLREGLRISTLLVTAAVVTLLSWGFGRWWLGGGNSPVQVGWLVGLLLIVTSAA